MADELDLGLYTRKGVASHVAEAVAVRQNFGGLAGVTRG
jgi:hypothetical protein